MQIENSTYKLNRIRRVVLPKETIFFFFNIYHIFGLRVDVDDWGDGWGGLVLRVYKPIA